jgi:spoIIIJ-associated protein
MDYVETEGDTIDQAIDNALKTLGVEREKITVEILSQGKKGILGFGAQKARVRAAVRRAPADLARPEMSEEPSAVTPEPVTQAQVAAAGEKARGVLLEILKLMGLNSSVQVRPGEKSDEVLLEITSDNGGLIIGRKGQTLEALQYLVTRIAADRQGSEGPHIIVDIENYRERRRRSLEDMALRLGEKAKRQRKTVTVDALSAADRRIVHAALQDDPWVTTKSLGQGAYRRLLIIPEGDRRKKDETTAAGAATEKPTPRSQSATPAGPRNSVRSSGNDH